MTGKKPRPDRPLTATTIRYTRRYILKDFKTGEVVFIGNSRECTKFLGTVRSSFLYSAHEGRWKRDGKDYTIGKVEFHEKVKLTGEERKKARANAEYAKQYRARKKRARLGFNERNSVSETEG